MGTEFIATQEPYSKQDWTNAPKRLIAEICRQLENHKNKIVFVGEDLNAVDSSYKLIDSLGNANFLTTCKD